MHCVVLEMGIENVFHVHCGDSNMLKFKMSSEGLYYYYINENGQKHMSLLNTVAKNMEGYTTGQIQRAKLARETMKKLGFPLEEDYKTGWREH